MKSPHPNPQRRISILAIILAVAGVVLLSAVALLSSLPNPLWLWCLLAVSFVSLEITAVEINDRLRISASTMAGFAAAVAFGRASAILAIVMMAALSAVHPDDIRERRWLQPAANFGQLVLSSAAGVAVFTVFLPHGPLGVGHLPLLAVGAAIGAVLHGWVNFRLVAAFIRMLYPDRELRPWSSLMGSHAALAVLGGLGALLGAAYVLVGPVILPLMLVVFAVGHVGFATQGQLKVAHEATVLGLVKAIEALDPHTRGHTDRVAHFAQITAERMGFDPDRLSRLRWAALIHDVGKVAVPPELLRKPGSLDEEEFRRMLRHMHVVEDMLAEVDVLAPVVRLAGGHHAILDPADDVHGDHDRLPTEASILAAAEVFDAMTSTRSYRAAVTQTAAFAELRADTDRLGADVVEALIEAITERGEVYGSPDEAITAKVARMVREREMRA